MKLFAFDLDDTLFPCDTKISERTLKALNTLSERGNILVFDSGRPFKGIRRFLDGLYVKDNVFIASCNGAALHDFSGHCLYLLPLRLSDYLFFHDTFSSPHLWIYFLDDKNRLGGDDYSNPWRDHEIKSDEATYLPSWRQLPLNSPVLKIVLAGEKKSLDDLTISATLRERFLIQRTKDVYYEAVRKEADKVVAIDYLREKLQIKKTDIYTFGDAENDLRLLKEYKGIAPIDADPRCLKVAKCIMKSAKEDGVAELIEKINEIGKKY